MKTYPLRVESLFLTTSYRTDTQTMTTERKIFLAGFAVLLVIIFYMFTRVERLENGMNTQSQSSNTSTQSQSFPTNNAKVLATQAAVDLQRAMEYQQRQRLEQERQFELRRQSDNQQATVEAGHRLRRGY